MIGEPRLPGAPPCFIRSAFAKLAVLNVPHPSVMRKFLSTRPRQFFRSWYMFFFQLPWLPEAVFSAFNFRIGARALLRSSRTGTFTNEDLVNTALHGHNPEP